MSRQRNNGHSSVMDVVNEDEGVMIRVPMSEPESRTYIARETGHIDARLTPTGTNNLRMLHAGLVDIGAALTCGRPVISKADAVKWLFENMESA